MTDSTKDTEIESSAEAVASEKEAPVEGAQGRGETEEAERQRTIEKIDQIIKANEDRTSENVEETIDLMTEIYQLAKGIGYENGQAHCLSNLGFAYYFQSKYQEALPRLLEAKKLFDKTGDTTGLGRVLTILAGVQFSMGSYETALANSYKAVQIFQGLGDHEMGGWSWYAMGTGYQEFGDYHKALEYHQNALELFKKVKHPSGEARALNGIGLAYQSLEKYPEALQFHFQGLKINQQLENPLGESRALNDLGICYQAMGDLDQALSYHERALEIRKGLGFRQAESTSLINLAKLHLENKEGEKALPLLRRALRIGREIEAKPRIFQAHEALSTAYEQTGDLERSLKHYRAFHEIRAEVLGDEASAKIKNLQIGFEVERAEKEAEIARLRNVELKEKNQELEKLLAELEEAQDRLVHSAKMAALGNLVAGIAHELNTPMGAMRSAIDVSTRCVKTIQERMEGTENDAKVRKDPEIRRALSLLESNNEVKQEASERVHRIVASLKTFSRIDEAPVQQADLNEGIESTITLLEHEFKDRISVVKHLGSIPRVVCAPGELNQVFMNVLMNAAHAIEGKGMITVKTWEDGDQVKIRIEDTGRGISKKRQESLFEPRFGERDNKVRVGMGLFSSYNIVRKHQGRIDVESNPGMGTTMTIVIPKDAGDHLKNSSIGAV